MTHRSIAAAAALACTLLGGCSHNAVFVTKTSLSIIDVDTTPAGVSVAQDRVEGYFGPRFDNGQVYPVTGYFQGRGSSFARNVRQVFAGGRAATLVVGDQSAAPPLPQKCSDNRDLPPLFFATGTTVGFKLGFAEGTPLPNSVVFGYRRKEAAIVPVSFDCQPSVLATLDSDAESRAEATDAKFGVAVTQYFATGAAAEMLAQDKKIKDIFVKEAQKSLSPVDAFGQRETLQRQLTAEIFVCADKLPASRAEELVADADRHDLLPSGGAAMIRGRAADARMAGYKGMLPLLNGDVDPRTFALEYHKAFVCSLAA